MSTISLSVWLLIALAFTGAAQSQPFNLSVKSQPAVIFLGVSQPITVTITFAVTPTVGTTQEYILFYYPPDPESGILWDEENNDTGSGVEQENSTARPRTRRYWEIAATSASFANSITIFLTVTEMAQPGIVAHEVRLLEVGNGRNTVAIAQTELHLPVVSSPTSGVTQTITTTLTVSTTSAVTVSTPAPTSKPLVPPPTWTLLPDQPSLVAPTIASTPTPIIPTAVSLAPDDNLLPTVQATLPLVAPSTSPEASTPAWLLFIVIAIVGLFVLGLLLLLLYASRSQRKLKPQVAGPTLTIRAGSSGAIASTGVEPEKQTCPDCGSRNEPGGRFCTVCGRELIPLTSPTTSEITRQTFVSAQKDAAASQPRHFPNVDLRVGRQTDVGMSRQSNEDSLLVLEITWNNRGINQSMCLLAVADGMGGHEGGEVASGLTVQVLAREAFQGLMPTASGLNSQPLDPTFWLQQTIQTTNEIIWQQRLQAENDMGSTLVVAVVVGNTATIAHVGDSRAYHINQQGIHQLTVDHSLVERLVATRQITREEARQHPQSNVIYRTLGDKEQVEIDVTVFAIPPGDYLLLCSDGLTGMIPDEKIWQIVQAASSPQVACSQLIQVANAGGGEDNISVILVKPELL